MMKKHETIDSLKALRLRKVRLAREINRCENRLEDEYLTLTQPVTHLVHTVQAGEYDGSLPLDGLYKFAVNAKRLADMVRIGAAIYQDYRKK